VTGPRIATASTSLASVEDRLRRALNLAGDVSVRFNADLIPVVLAEDATRIGNATTRGRRFGVGSFMFAPAAAGTFAIKAGSPLVGKGFVYARAVNISLAVRLVNAATADPYAITTVSTPWLERGQSDSDFAPLLTSGNTLQADSVIGNVILSAQAEAAGQQFQFPEVFLSTGDKLIFRAAGVMAAFSVNCNGYVY